jgi:hypothetical protein
MNYRDLRSLALPSIAAFMLALAGLATPALYGQTLPAPAAAGIAPEPSEASGPVMSPLEQLVFNQLTAATANISGVAPTSVVELFKVSDIGGPLITASLITQYAGFPNADQYDDGSYGPLSVGLVPATAGINPAKVASVVAQMANQMLPTDSICWIDWSGTTNGTFSTVAIARTTGVVFDTFSSNMPAQWPLPSGSGPVPFALQPIQEVPGPGFEWKITNGFGVEVINIEVKVTPLCLEGKVLDCTASITADANFLWEARVEKSCKVIKNPDGSNSECCICEISAGYASGFKSLEVEAGGFKLKVSGSLGVSGLHVGTYMACCPAPAAQ